MPRNIIARIITREHRQSTLRILRIILDAEQLQTKTPIILNDVNIQLVYSLLKRAHRSRELFQASTNETAKIFTVSSFFLKFYGLVNFIVSMKWQICPSVKNIASNIRNDNVTIICYLTFVSHAISRYIVIKIALENYFRVYFITSTNRRKVCR